MLKKKFRIQPQANTDHQTQIIWGSGVFDTFLLPTLEKLVVAYIIILMVGYTKFHEGTADLEYHSPKGILTKCWPCHQKLHQTIAA